MASELNQEKANSFYHKHKLPLTYFAVLYLVPISFQCPPNTDNASFFVPAHPILKMLLLRAILLPCSPKKSAGNTNRE